MRWLPALWLAACTAPGEEAEVEVDGTVFLEPGERLEEAFDERVRVVATPRARLTPEGPLLERPASTWRRPLVVVDPGPWPRVGLDVSDLRVLVYVDRGSLERRVVREAPGAVQLGLGTLVAVVEEDDDRVQVEAEFEHWTATPWVPRGAVDEVWSDRPDRREWEPPEGPYVALRGGAELSELPDGEVVGVVHPDAGLARWAVVVGEPDGDPVRVVFDDRGTHVDAWVSRDEVEWNPSASGASFRCGGVSTGYGVWGVAGPTAVVPAGTLLTAGPDGPVVAVALADLVVPEEAFDEGAVVTRETAVGRVEVWAHPADVVAR